MEQINYGFNKKTKGFSIYKKIISLLILLLASFTLVSCGFGGGYNSGSSKTYSLSGESFTAQYVGSTYAGHSYRATLSNTTSETYRYSITVRVFNSTGKQILSKSSSYTLSGRGVTNVSILTNPGNLYSTYEVSVSAYKQ